MSATVMMEISVQPTRTPHMAEMLAETATYAKQTNTPITTPQNALDSAAKID